MNGRKTFLCCLPDIEESTVKKYLINTSVLTANDARTYKISRPFALQQFVHSVLFNDESGSEIFTIIQAQCNPSQSTNPDEIKVVYVIIDRYLGEPYGGFCTCTVGESESCGHIGAVLFKLAELQATGAVEGPSCTEVLCKWSEPKGSKVEPTVFKDLNIRKTGSIRRTVEDYGQKVVNPTPPTYDQVVNLRASLIEATHHIGQYCPAIHIMNCSRFKPPGTEHSPANLIEELPETLLYDNHAIAPAKEVEVKTTPAAITQLVSVQYSSVQDIGFSRACEDLFYKAENMDIDINEIDINTKGQSDNPEWYLHRRGAITATKFAAVLRATCAGKKKSFDSLTKEIFQTKHDRLKNVPAVKWGKRNESKARQAYIKKFGKSHKEFKMEDHGLMVYKDCNFIRGSPDGITTCACHGNVLLEIKCPFNARMLTVKEGVTLGKIKYLDIVNGQFQLKENTSDGYYAQVQGLMGITEIKKCVLVVWTTRDMVTITIDYNEKFFLNKLVPSCKEFFREYIVPRLLLKEASSSKDHQVTDNVEYTAPSSEINVPTPTLNNTLNLLEETSPSTDSQLFGNDYDHELYIATPLNVALNRVQCDDFQPEKRKRLTITSADIRKSYTKRSPQIVLPTTVTTTVKCTTSAQLILAETMSTYKCASCRKDLPEDNIAPDNSDASVGCDCPNCGGCDIWMCWPCAKYDQQWADAGDNWYCPECVRECDIIY